MKDLTNVDRNGKVLHTRKEKNRAIQQEALREKLSAGKHVEDVLRLVRQIENEEVPDTRLPAYKLVIDTKLKLINKYLPDLRSMEIEHGGTIEHAHTHERVSDTVAWIEGIIERDGAEEPASESLSH